jgi:hypothetical protein
MLPIKTSRPVSVSLSFCSVEAGAEGVEVEAMVAVALAELREATGAKVMCAPGTSGGR